MMNIIVVNTFQALQLSMKAQELQKRLD